MLHAVKSGPKKESLKGERSQEQCWHVYMVRCSDGTLYSGIAKSLQQRIAAHNHGRSGARYTRSRRPVVLVYQEAFPNRSAAARREHELKQLPREKKLKLAEGGLVETSPATNPSA